MAWYEGWIDEVAAIFVAVVVSKAVQEIGPKLGLSDSVTGIAAVVGGAYAGRVAYDYANASPSGDAAGAGDANQVGMDLSSPTQGPAASVAPSDAAPSGPGAAGIALDPGSAIGARPGDADIATMQAKPPLQISSDPTPTPTPTPAPPPAQSANVVATGAATTPPATDEPSWFEKLMRNDKTWDMVMAGMTGYSEAGMAKEEREYPEKIRQQNAAGWSAGDPNPGGFLSLSQQYPSQQY